VAWSGFAVALAGVALVAGAGGDASLLGDALVLAGAAIAALYIVAQTDLLPGRDPVSVTAVQMAAAAAFALPVALLGGHVPTGAPDPHALIATVLLATAGSLLPFTLYAYGQTRVSAEVAGAFVNLEPLVGAAMGALAFQDPFGPSQMLGAGAILGGILLSAAASRAPVAATS
jgi:drug/metabolite transporter (DMT)-like permease